MRDDVEDALGLPSGPYEVPLVLCDRLFDATGQLRLPDVADVAEAPWIPELHGDALLVNGKLFPFLEVEPRAYRLRIVNASNTRFYRSRLERRPVLVPDRDRPGAPRRARRAAAS